MIYMNIRNNTTIQINHNKHTTAVIERADKLQLSTNVLTLRPFHQKIDQRNAYILKLPHSVA